MKLSIRKSIAALKPFSRTFVERPRFAMVIAICLTIAGSMAIFTLPISQYPQVTPPSIQVSYTYPGANATEALKGATDSLKSVSASAVSDQDAVQYGDVSSWADLNALCA